jgi:hypothetical protein
MLITPNDVYAVMPRRVIDDFFPNKQEREKRLSAAIERQTDIVREFLGKIANPVPQTVKWAIATRVAWELSFEGDINQIGEKYDLLYKEADKKLKAYKDGTILPNQIGGKTVLYSGGAKKRFNFFTGNE